MNHSDTRHTATIYQFPAGGRASRARARNIAVSDAIGSLHRFSKAEAEPETIVDTGSWYHEEALREVDTVGKH